jgi:SET domain-containing protein
MLFASIYIGSTLGKGRGVFTADAIPQKTVIEISPVIVMSKQERILLDQTLMHDYIFEWGNHKNQCCVALGYVSVYNHSYEANCEYEMDYNDEVIRIKTMRYIQAGEELFINYNGDWDNKKRVWFEAK